VSVTRDLDIKDFARRVERLCDFLYAQVTSEIGKTGSNDLKVIEDLKEDAADIQFDCAHVLSKPLEGLYNYMNGADIAPKAKN
jgi:hypothetical protein